MKSTFIIILSTGLLFGCGTNNDEVEPKKTEAPLKHKKHQEEQNKNENR